MGTTGNVSQHHAPLLLERIVRSLHLDSKRCTHQVELLAETAFKKTFVGGCYVLQRIAMDDDHWGFIPPWWA